MTDHNGAPMGRGELERIGSHLWGAGWKACLADHFEIRRATVGNWIRDDSVAPWAAAQLRALAMFPPASRGTTGAARADQVAELVGARLDAMAGQAGAAGWQAEEIRSAVAAWLGSDRA